MSEQRACLLGFGKDNGTYLRVCAVRVFIEETWNPNQEVEIRGDISARGLMVHESRPLSWCGSEARYNRRGQRVLGPGSLVMLESWPKRRKQNEGGKREKGGSDAGLAEFLMEQKVNDGSP